MDTGVLYPTESGQGVTGVNQQIWDNIANGYAEDGVYASSFYAAGTPRLTRRYRLTNYGFGIPAAATILGVQVDVKLKASHDAAGRHVNDSYVGIRVNGSAWSYENKARDAGIYWPIVDGWITYGGPTDHWNILNTDQLLQPSHFDDFSGFDIQPLLVATDGDITAYVDVGTMTIWYEAAGVVRSTTKVCVGIHL